MSSEKASESGSIFRDGPQFISESIDELKKITTPTRQETIQATMATVMIILFFSVCLLVLDFICHWLMTLVT
jgi:preprotein translocase SecE subunit